jgi:hypothetical protein
VPVSFTVILPTHNRHESLLRALESVRRQTRPPVEVVVIADGCTDGSVDAVRRQADDLVAVLDLPKGPGKGWAHRNEPVARARGDVVAYLSDDDLWLPDHLQRVGAVWDALAPDLVQASSCMVRADGELELFAVDWSEPRARARLVDGFDSRTPMSAVSHRPGLCAEAGGWSDHPPAPPDGLPKGDLDLWRRIAAMNPHTEIVREPTVVFMPASPVHGGRRVERDPVRAERQRQILARIADPDGVVSLRQEVTRAAGRASEDAAEENLRLRADRERTDQYARSLGQENQRLRADRERAEEYARSLEQLVQARDAEIAGLAARVGELESAPG